ncbi:hypothetical protein ACFXHA_09510 [Nocardia sp. NPDC059240]|uniref:hypothetical protein n=1 Tax=Nocardia sp. NPDC059240 TaxID=3346786 RepID=UPI00369A0078
MPQNQGGNKIRGILAAVGAVAVLILIRVGVRLIDGVFGIIGLLVFILICVGAYFALKKRGQSTTTASSFAPAYTQAPSPYDHQNTPAQGYPAPSGYLPPPAGAPNQGYPPPPSGPGYPAPQPGYPAPGGQFAPQGPAQGYAPAPQGYPTRANGPAPQPNQAGPHGYPTQPSGYQQQGYQPGYSQTPPNYPPQQR